MSVLRTTKSIYAKDKNTYVIIESTLGLIPPLELEMGFSEKGVVKLIYLSCYYDLFTTIYKKCQSDFTQKSLGDFLGFTQQQIANFVSQHCFYPSKPKKIEKLLELFFKYFTLPEKVTMLWHE